MKKTFKICFTSIFIILCFYSIWSTISTSNTKIESHKQFWNQIEKNLILINNEISEVLDKNNTDTTSSLKTIALTYEDTGAILDYNSKTLFNWYEGTGIWNTIANKVFDIATSNAKSQTFSQKDIDYLKNLQLANEELLKALQAKSSSLYKDKSYQTNLINQYVSHFESK